MHFRAHAISVTGNKGVEEAMEWLLAHADDPALSENTNASTALSDSTNTPPAPTLSLSSPTAVTVPPPDSATAGAEAVGDTNSEAMDTTGVCIFHHKL